MSDKTCPLLSSLLLSLLFFVTLSVMIVKRVESLHNRAESGGDGGDMGLELRGERRDEEGGEERGERREERGEKRKGDKRKERKEKIEEIGEKRKEIRERREGREKSPAWTHGATLLGLRPPLRGKY